jgi:hypothetical protein
MTTNDDQYLVDSAYPGCSLERMMRYVQIAAMAENTAVAGFPMLLLCTAFQSSRNRHQDSRGIVPRTLMEL